MHSAVYSWITSNTKLVSNYNERILEMNNKKVMFCYKCDPNVRVLSSAKIQLLLVLVLVVIFAFVWEQTFPLMNLQHVSMRKKNQCLDEYSKYNQCIFLNRVKSIY